jgi:PTH1 family peptidyl-tRNA hydrolase
MKVVVGLGNPGKKYQDTRHNIGFRVAAELARRHGVGTPRAKFQSEVVEGAFGLEKFLVMCPATYMNRSGASVLAVRDFYKLELSDLLIVCDDFNLPLARIRVRAKGSSGGQKGLEDVIRRVGSNEFSRLRIGIGPPPEQWEVADYVLSKFTAEERDEVDIATQRAADATEVWLRDGIDKCMNQYNASD